MSVSERMTVIADAIREKTGGTDKLSLDGMAQAIPDVYDAGKTDGVEKGIEQGKKAQYDEFWDTLQRNGARRYYQYAFFNEGWYDSNYNPKYPIITNNTNYVFSSSGMTDTKVPIDISNATSGGYMFFNSVLKTIRKLIVSEKVTYSDFFRNCNALENIVFEGEIGNNIDFASSPLSKNSIESIVNALSKTVTGKTLTLKKTAVNNAFGIDVDDETTYPDGTEFYNLRHSKDNWTFNYV